MDGANECRRITPATCLLCCVQVMERLWLFIRFELNGLCEPQVVSHQEIQQFQLPALSLNSRLIFCLFNWLRIQFQPSSRFPAVSNPAVPPHHDTDMEPAGREPNSSCQALAKPYLGNGPLELATCNQPVSQAQLPLVRWTRICRSC